MAGWVGFHHSVEVGDFACRRCGWHGRGAVSVVGVGRAILFFDRPERALVGARQDASYRGRKAIQGAYCRKCGQKNPGEELRFWLPYAVIAALTLALVGRELMLFYRLHQLLAASDVPMRIVSFETIALALLVAGVGWFGWKKWKTRNAGVEWLD